MFDVHQQEVRIRFRKRLRRNGRPKAYGPIGEVFLVLSHHPTVQNNAGASLWTVMTVQSSQCEQTDHWAHHWAEAVAIGMVDWINCMVWARSPAASAFSA